jgi:hypothetical protein
VQLHHHRLGGLASMTPLDLTFTVTFTFTLI